MPSRDPARDFCHFKIPNLKVPEFFFTKVHSVLYTPDYDQYNWY